MDDGSLIVERSSDIREHRSLHGLTRALLSNMVIGVDSGFTRTLEIVGYRVQQQGNGVNLQLGFSHDIIFDIPEGVVITPTGTAGSEPL